MALAVVVVVGVAFYLFLARTRMGKAIRASAQDPTTAGLMGVNINSVLAICFGLGLGMAGIAGSLLSTLYPIQTSMGLQYTVIAMIVVVLGGLGSITGAMIGGRHPGDRVAARHVLPADDDLHRLLRDLHRAAAGKAQRDHG